MQDLQMRKQHWTRGVGGRQIWLFFFFEFGLAARLILIHARSYVIPQMRRPSCPPPTLEDRSSRACQALAAHGHRLLRTRRSLCLPARDGTEKETESSARPAHPGRRGRDWPCARQSFFVPSSWGLHELVAGSGTPTRASAQLAINQLISVFRLESCHGIRCGKLSVGSSHQRRGKGGKDKKTKRVWHRGKSSHDVTVYVNHERTM